MTIEAVEEASSESGCASGSSIDDPRAAARRAFGARAAAVQRHELANDGKSNAAAAGRRFGVAIESDVRLPDALPIVVRNPGALILDPDARTVAGDLRADGDRLPRRPVLHGVVEEVEQNLTQRIAIERA